MMSVQDVGFAAARAGLPLRGRERELALIAAVLAAGETRVLVAQGPAGVGKTALLREALHRASSDGALVGAGKYAEKQGGAGLEPIVTALDEALASGLEKLFDPQAGKDDLMRSLGPNGDVLVALGSQVLWPTDSLAAGRPLLAAEADERVVVALLQCIRWLESFEVPVLLLIDDWGRASSQAQEVYRRIAAEPALKRTRLLATQRPDEAFSGVFPPRVAKIIEVGSLRRTSQLQIARDILQEKAEAAGDVLEFLGPTAETPFDLVQSLQLLESEGAIGRKRGVWRLDRRLAAPALAGAVAESVVRQVANTHLTALRLAEVLAVYGDQAPVADLAAAARMTEFECEAALETLAQTGLARIRGAVVACAHDQLRAEVLKQLPRGERARLAARIAETLRGLGVRPADGQRGVVMLWRRREGGLEAVDAAWWCAAFTAGAGHARERGDRDGAQALVSTALELNAQTGGPDFELCAEAAFAAIARADHADAERWGQAMLASARTAAELAAADEIRVFARRMSGDLDSALEVAGDVLARVGVRLPRQATLPAVVGALLRVLRFDPGKAVNPLPAEALERDAPLMRATNGLGSLLFERSPQMAIILATKALPARLVYGTAAAAATYALMCSAFGLYGRAGRWADAADRLQGPDQPLRAVAKQYSSSFGHVFVRPRSTTRTRGAEMEALAYASGDLAVAAYGNRDKVLDALFSDDHLASTLAAADEAIRVAERLKDLPTILHVRALRQFIEQIRTPSRAGWRLDGDHFASASSWQELERGDLGNAARAIASLEALLGVLHGRYDDVVALHRRPWPRYRAAPFQAQTQIWTFATSIALLRTGRRPSRFGLWNIGRLAKLNPADFAHRSWLLRAEVNRAARRPRAALDAYQRAVDAAAGSTCLLEQGLVGFLAAEGCEALDRPASAHRYREESDHAWRRLGAEALLSDRFGPRMAAEAHHPASSTPTERELQLLAEREAADRISRARSRLLAAVGHELRTPLQGALGLLELAEETARPLDVSSLRRALASLSSVVGDLTDLGALEGGVLSVRSDPFDARATAGSVVALQAASAESAQRRIKFDTRGPPLWVRGDEGRVRQVLSNLVGNALRHGAGDVSLRIVHDRAAGRITFLVTDQGPPLSEAGLRRIFEPFERGRESDDGGLGVGLFLGRHLARRMGGDLTAEPDPVLGNTFRLEIAAPAAVPPALNLGGLVGRRILIAEDNRLSREVLAALLRHEGCDVVEAEDGLQALDRAQSGAFDLLLLDQQMPGRSGVEVVGALREVEMDRPLIVLMSAGANPDAVVPAIESGVDLILQKPVGLQTLRDLATRLPTPSRPPGKAAYDRVAELKQQLGASGNALLRKVRPAIEAEIEMLAQDAARADMIAFSAHLHRLRGLVVFFGVAPLESLFEVEEPKDARAAQSLVARLRRAAEQLDWSDFDSEPFKAGTRSLRRLPRRQRS